MDHVKILCEFIKRISEDPRIGPAHISLYVAILYHFEAGSFKEPAAIFSRDLMKQAKISGMATFYKCLNDLKAAGYIHYLPSYNPFLGSLFYLSMQQA